MTQDRIKILNLLNEDLQNVLLAENDGEPANLRTFVVNQNLTCFIHLKSEDLTYGFLFEKLKNIEEKKKVLDLTNSVPNCSKTV